MEPTSSAIGLIVIVALYINIGLCRPLDRCTYRS